VSLVNRHILKVVTNRNDESIRKTGDAVSFNIYLLFSYKFFRREKREEVTGSWRKLRNEEIQKFYFLLNIYY
jgi:hypothetical protein